MSTRNACPWSKMLGTRSPSLTSSKTSCSKTPRSMEYTYAATDFMHGARRSKKRGGILRSLSSCLRYWRVRLTLSKDRRKLRYMENAELETATLAAGCFWCVEAIFDDLKGV